MLVCVYMYAYIYIFMYACMCVSKWARENKWTSEWIYVCTHVCMYGCMYVCLYVCMCVCVCVCVCVRQTKKSGFIEGRNEGSRRVPMMQKISIYLLHQNPGWRLQAIWSSWTTRPLGEKKNQWLLNMIIASSANITLACTLTYRNVINDIESYNIPLCTEALLLMESKVACIPPPSPPLPITPRTSREQLAIVNMPTTLAHTTFQKLQLSMKRKRYRLILK